MDFITVLAHTDKTVKIAKRIHQDGTQTFVDLPYHYRGAELPCEDLPSLVKALDAASRLGAFVVRGRILPGVDRTKMRRAHVTDPTLTDASHHWLLLDFDNHRPEVDRHDFAQNTTRYAEDARNLLPEPFRGAVCWYQATGGAGFKPGVRLRLGFWLDRAVSNLEIKTWLRGLPLDFSIFTPSQPCFVANPSLAPGLEDPVRVRSGVLPGQHNQVAVPATFSGGGGGTDYTEDLAKATKRVLKAEEGERRNVLNRTAYALAYKYGEEELPAEKLEEALLAAATVSKLPGHEARLTVKNAVRDGRSRGDINRSGWRQEIAKDKEGNARATAANVSLFLEHHEAFKGRLALDGRSYQPIWTNPAPWGGDAPRAYTAEDDTRIIEWFQAETTLDVREGWVRSAVHKAAALHTFDEVQDWIRSLPSWDGKERLGTFFIRHLGAEDTPLTRAQTECWFIQTVRRAFATLSDPVRADYIIVLSGDQGLGKSTTLQTLCGPGPKYFLDSLPDLKDKDGALLMARSWIVELSELTQRKADRDIFKAFITRQVDSFRPPYGRHTINVPRRCSLIGTTNEKVYLVDPTGNRRFWPMRCTARADLDLVASELGQVWAEAKYYADCGRPAYLSPELELAAREPQEEARQVAQVDGWEDRLRDVLAYPAPMGLGDLGQARMDTNGYLKRVRYKTLVDLTGEDIYRSLAQVEEALSKLGWVKKRVNNVVVWDRGPSFELEVREGDRKRAN